jgi:dTDP-4-amino-4,6-dideoxygalactose transaminase
MGGDEIKFVNEAFDTNWVSPAGPHLDAFEKELAKYNNILHCAALSSGTAAIHLALIILGVREGDEVLCSTFTFSGTCNPIVYLKATPVFIDSERDTWNMDPDRLAEAIEDRIKKGKKPKAIIPVHLYGMPAKIDRIVALGRQYEIPVIEDAAEGLGSTYNQKKLGSFGDIGIFSFNGNKIITTSGGGALTSENEAWVKKAKFLSTQARDAAPHYQHSEIGYNYRLSNVCAGIGRGQLQVLDKRVAQRRAMFDFYADILADFDKLEFQPERKLAFSNRWLSCILLPHESPISTESLRLFMEKDDIESRPLWKPMHLQPIFKNYPVYGGNVSEDLFNRGICLPSGSNLGDTEKERISAALISGLKNVSLNKVY